MSGYAGRGCMTEKNKNILLHVLFSLSDHFTHNYSCNHSTAVVCVTCFVGVSQHSHYYLTDPFAVESAKTEIFCLKGTFTLDLSLSDHGTDSLDEVSEQSCTY